jgi:hypothetical protein
VAIVALRESIERAIGLVNSLADNRSARVAVRRS